MTVNSSSVIDVIREGNIKMEKIDLFSVRFRQSRRIAKEKKAVHGSIYHDTIRVDKRNDTSQIIE